jgi:hypothetical protein
VQGAGAQQGIPQWQLESTPRLTIGEEGGPAEFLRVVGVFQLSRGLIAVLNGTTGEVRIFDGRGDHVTTFGRQGAGPGEFQAPAAAWRAGDTLMVGDVRLNRVTTLLAGRAPRLLGTIQVTANHDKDGNFSIRGRIADGRWLAVGMQGFSPDPKAQRLKGWVGLVASGGGGSVEWLAEQPSATSFVYNPSGDFKQGGFVGIGEFSPWLHGIASAGSLWFGESGSDSLLVVEGARRRVVRLPIAPRAPSQALIDARRKSALDAAPDERSRAAIEARMAAQVLPKSLPYFEALVPGHAGEVWVQEYAGLNSASTRYLVIGPDLKPRAWVSVPAGYRVTEAGQDYVVGVHHDEDGVETVRAYGLKR